MSEPNWQGFNKWYIGVYSDIQYAKPIPYAPIEYDSETSIPYSIYPVLDGDDRYFVSGFDNRVKTMRWQYILPELKEVFDFINNIVGGSATESTREFYLWTGVFAKKRKIFIKDLRYRPTMPSLHYRNLWQYTRFQDSAFVPNIEDVLFGVYGDNIGGQGFVATDFDKIDALSVLVTPWWDASAGYLYPEDDLVLSIYNADANFYPTGTALATQTFTKESFAAKNDIQTWANMLFPTPLALKVGNKYAITMRAHNCRATVSLYGIHRAMFGKYTTGNLVYSLNDGTAWAGDSTSDITFGIRYGYDTLHLDKQLLYEGQIDFILLEDDL